MAAMTTITKMSCDEIADRVETIEKSSALALLARVRAVSASMSIVREHYGTDAPLSLRFALEACDHAAIAGLAAQALMDRGKKDAVSWTHLDAAVAHAEAAVWLAARIAHKYVI